MRTEIGMALSRKMLIVPVLVDGAVLPKAAELPGPLRPLVLYQAVEIRKTQYFERDADALTKQLEGTLLRFWRWRAPIAALLGGTAVVGLTLFAYKQLNPIELLQAPSGVAKPPDRRRRGTQKVKRSDSTFAACQARQVRLSCRRRAGKRR